MLKNERYIHTLISSHAIIRDDEDYHIWGGKPYKRVLYSKIRLSDHLCS
jgi:hypothetical protein